MIDKIKEFIQSPFFIDIINSFLSKIGVVIFGFFTTYIITNHYSVDDYGKYSFILTAVLLGHQLLHLGFPAANTYYLSGKHRILRFIRGNMLVLSGIMSIVSFAALTFGNYFFWHKPWDHVYIGAAIIPFMIHATASRASFIGIKKIRVFNYIELIIKILFLILSWIIISKEYSIKWILIAFLTHHIVQSILIEIRFQSIDKKSIQPSWKLTKKMINYSGRIYIILLFAFLVLKIDVFFIEHYLGDKATGLYSLSTTLSLTMTMIVPLIAALLIPKLKDIATELEKIKKLRNIFFYCVLLLLLINWGFYVIGEPLILQIFPKYQAAMPSLYILLAASSVVALQTILVQYYNSIGKLKFLIGYWAITSLCNIVLNVLWIEKYGIIGAAYASLISYSIMFLLVFFKIVKIYLRALK